MYKEMIPANVIARKAKLRPLGDRLDACPTAQAPPTSLDGDTAVQNELTEWKERCLRLAADFDNFKKRISQENERRSAEQKHAFVRDLLPVVDNLERALTNGPTHPSGQLREGVQLTLKQLTQVLNQHGFVSRDDLGEPFDPQFHEAVCVRPDPMQADQTVLEVWQRGWLRGEELFRPAKVVVNDLSHSTTTEQCEDINHQTGTIHG